jgi:fermentation-respiration switch protein FrsA (DUF1100 family)
MRSEKVTFLSDGLKLAGVLTFPDGDGPFPTVVLGGGGWLYVKEINLPDYARFAAARGIASLYFDYRNNGESEGDRRQHLDPWEQIADYRNALSFLETDDRFDAKRLGVWGISFAGAHALVLGAIDRRVRCVVSGVPLIDGYEMQRRLHGNARFRAYEEAILEARRTRYKTGEDTYHTFGGTDQGVVTIPTDEVVALYDGLQKTVAPNYVGRSTFASDEALMNYSVYPYIKRLVETPTLMMVTERDDYTYIDLQTQAFNDIPTVKKKLVNLPGTSRIEFYRDKSPVETAASIGADWLAEHLLLDHERAAYAS